MIGDGERKGEADDVGACVWEVRQVDQRRRGPAV